jgi:hypothetical protein
MRCSHDAANVHVYASVIVYVTVFANVIVNVRNTPMITYNVALSFGNYIAEPYWPEMAQLIDIQKESGMNRARSSANRRKALEEHLKGISMTLAEYDALEILAHRPFYTDDAGQIIIPAARFLDFLTHTCHKLRSNGRPCDPDQVRSRFQVSDFSTGKTEKDGDFKRFAVVNSGPGGKLSNQRGFRSSQYIADFTARGTITFDPQFVRPPVLETALRWAGDNIGMGSSRKMGYGRFKVAEFAEQKLKVAA